MRRGYNANNNGWERKVLDMATFFWKERHENPLSVHSERQQNFEQRSRLFTRSLMFGLVNTGSMPPDFVHSCIMTQWDLIYILFNLFIF
jgi:hypothetical protein